MISAQTRTVAAGGAPRRHAGARLGHDGASDSGGLDDLALHGFACEGRAVVDLIVNTYYRAGFVKFQIGLRRTPTSAFHAGPTG